MFTLSILPFSYNSNTNSNAICIIDEQCSAMYYLIMANPSVRCQSVTSARCAVVLGSFVRSFSLVWPGVRSVSVSRDLDLFIYRYSA